MKLSSNSKKNYSNKKVKEHEEYLIDKSLIKKINTVKTTIKNSNQFYERKLKSLILFKLKKFKIR